MKIVVSRNAAVHVMKKGIYAHEIHEAVSDPARMIVRNVQGRYTIFGQTSGGRYLKIIVRKTTAGLELKTAWNMAQREKRGFIQHRRRRRETDE